METLLGLMPLDIHFHGVARTAAQRLKINGMWISQIQGHSTFTIIIQDPVLDIESDLMAVKELFDDPVHVMIEKTTDWGEKESDLL